MKGSHGYAIVFEPSSTGYSAYVPDLPGCVAFGATIEDTTECMRTSIRLYIEALLEDGSPIPEPATVVMELSA